MTQPTNLYIAYDPKMALNLKVGAVDIVDERLYYRDSNGLLVIAGANQDAELFYPLTAEAAGRNVAAVPLAHGVFPVVASGAITKEAKLACAASGKVKVADANDRVIARAMHACADGETLSIIGCSEQVGTDAGFVIVGAGTTAAMVAGVISTAAAYLASGDIIVFSRKTLGTAQGDVSITAQVAATSFELTSTANTETSTFNYFVLRAV